VLLLLGIMLLPIRNDGVQAGEMTYAKILHYEILRSVYASVQREYLFWRAGHASPADVCPGFLRGW